MYVGAEQSGVCPAPSELWMETGERICILGLPGMFVFERWGEETYPCLLRGRVLVLGKWSKP